MLLIHTCCRAGHAQTSSTHSPLGFGRELPPRVGVRHADHACMGAPRDGVDVPGPPFFSCVPSRVATAATVALATGVGVMACGARVSAPGCPSASSVSSLSSKRTWLGPIRLCGNSQRDPYQRATGPPSVDHWRPAGDPRVAHWRVVEGWLRLGYGQNPISTSPMSRGRSADGPLTGAATRTRVPRGRSAGRQWSTDGGRPVQRTTGVGQWATRGAPVVGWGGLVMLTASCGGVVAQESGKETARRRKWR